MYTVMIAVPVGQWRNSEEPMNMLRRCIKSTDKLSFPDATSKIDGKPNECGLLTASRVEKHVQTPYPSGLQFS
jgi:hypothetical protein